MKTPTGALITFLWLQLDCVSLGNEVEQSPSTLSVQEGNTAVITCTYTDTASEYFPWYKQEPGKGPQLLVAIRSNMGEKKDQRLTVLLNKTAKHLSLHIASIQPGDSAAYFCAARTQCFPAGAGAQSVTQPDDHITVSEGARLELKCNYSSSVSPYLFWSVQYPDQGLQLLLKYVSGDNLVSGIKGFEAEFRRNEKSFHLRKIPAHWKDSAKYFCALSDTVPGAAGGAEHKPPGHCSSVFVILGGWHVL
uniref:Uncharacterized protein n=1 Tax=Rangifer tarandus platyrhynchus TaxID=3082113 RepID=A0ACB0FFT6_RANTA|nr:unnamed protein product [Rangifer tarandus platyrhynchus]